MILALPIYGWAQKNEYTIKGQLKNLALEGKMLYLFYELNGQRITDSAKVVGNKYVFHGKAEDLVLANLLGASPSKGVTRDQVASVFIVPGTTTITHTNKFSDFSLRGAAANADYQKLKELLRPALERYILGTEKYQVASKTNNEEEMAAALEQMKQSDSLIKVAYLHFFNSHPTSTIALFVLQKYLPYNIVAEEAEPLYDKLSDQHKASKAGVELKRKIDVAKRTSIGQTAPDFTLSDTLGNAVTLRSFRGKYVLIDFWASWCGPCRQENPNVLKAYNQFKSQNFTVLGVSLDRPDARAKWIKAIQEDALPWTQVSDLKGWSADVAKIYGVNAIPQNFLVDPNGKIIGKNLRGKELEKKLAELITH